MQRILFVCLNAYKAFNPQSTAQIGGTEIQIALIAQEMAKNPELDLHCIIGDFHQKAKEEYGGVTVHRSFPLRSNLYTLLLAPCVILKLLITICPNVIVSSPAGPEVGISCLYAKLFRKKFIFRAASDIDCNREKANRMHAMARWLYVFGIAHANLIIVQHEGQRKDIKKYHNRDSIIIRNGYPLAPSSEKDPLQPILWVGSSRQVKRPDLFLKIARNMPQHQFQMILSRSGDKAIYRSAQRAAAQLQNVNFLGEVSFDTTRTHIARSKLVVGTSDYEGFPNIYVLASLAGVPVVSLRINPDDYLTQSTAGVCVKGDVSRMELEITKYMENANYYYKSSEAALSYAKENFTISSILPQWFSAIRTTDYS